MSRYDGLIIPRSYSEYINKTDAATLSQALALPGVMDDTPTAGSSKPVKSSGLVGLSAVDVVETGNMHPATSNAVAETAADIETEFANAMSYSTSEVNTGKKWIDGKNIYKRVFVCSTNLDFLAETWYDLCNYFNGLSGTVSTMGTLVDIEVHVKKDYIWNNYLVLKDHPNSGALGFWGGVPNTIQANDGFIILEYTKTTD